MKHLKLKLIDLSHFAPARADFLSSLETCYSDLVVLDTVSARPGEDLIPLLGFLSITAGPKNAAGPLVRIRTYQLDPRGREFRNRARVLYESTPDWRKVLSPEAMEEAKPWYNRVCPDLPKDGNVHERVLCSFAVLSCARKQMKGLYELSNTDAYLLSRDYVVDTVLVSDGARMFASTVSPSVITEAAGAHLYERDLDLMAIEPTLKPMGARLIMPCDFEIRIGSSLSGAADRIVRDIVEDHFDRINQWRPTYYSDIASDPLSFSG